MKLNISPAHKRKVQKRVKEIRDNMVNYCTPFWDDIKSEQAVYNNTDPHDMDTSLGGRVKPIVKGKSLYPKITEAIDTVHPRLDQGLPRARFLPDDTSISEEDNIFALIKDLQNWFDMYEEVDSEGDLHAVASLWVLAGGTAIRKVTWDKHQERLSCPTLSPLQFMTDACSRIDLLDARYCGQYDQQPYHELKLKYEFKRKRATDEAHRVDEIWIRKNVAQDFLGLDAPRMLKSILIDDVLVDIRPSHHDYPDFPYTAWRNFLRINSSGRPNEFWGFGYARKLWRQQKVLDEAIANLLIQIGNQSSGKVLSKYGALKNPAQLRPQHGLFIELNDGYEVSDILQLRPEEISAVHFQLIQMMVEVIEQTSGVNAAFSGEAPFAGISGKAVAALQAAAFTHIANVIRGMIAYRMRMARIKAAFIQQYAKQPISPNLWRGGIDIQTEFPKEARTVGFKVEIHDTSMLPQTPAGRLQLGQLLLQAGLSLEKFLEITGIDKAYGATTEDFPMPIPGLNGNGSGASPNEDVLMGRDAQAI